MPVAKSFDITITWTTPVDLDLCVFYRSCDGREGGVFSDEFRSNSGDLGRLDDFPFMIHLGDSRAPLAGQTGSETVRVGRQDVFERIDVVIINYGEAIDLLDVDYSDPGGACHMGDIEIKSAPTGSGQAYHLATLRRQPDGQLHIETVNRVITLREAYDTIPGFALICE